MFAFLITYNSYLNPLTTMVNMAAIIWPCFVTIQSMITGGQGRKETANYLLAHWIVQTLVTIMADQLGGRLNIYFALIKITILVTTVPLMVKGQERIFLGHSLVTVLLAVRRLCVSHKEVCVQTDYDGMRESRKSHRCTCRLPWSREIVFKLRQDQCDDNNNIDECTRL
ncbi:hypothetical protein HDE_02108 [Halotydeus destructor]|nr:hypothetical protein HDE_02108 [Halotydeus destructor]